MLYTGSHNAWKDSDILKKYAISGNRGKDADYRGLCYPALAPKISFWRIWHSGIGIVPECENTKYYIIEYWNQVLSKLNPEEVYKELDGSILLCYEPNGQFCHRHLVAAWLEITLGVEVPEARPNGNEIEIIPRSEKYKEYLKKVMGVHEEARKVEMA